jgi:hypothetical protein
MTKETTNAGKLGRLQRLSMALSTNSSELAHLEGSRALFMALLAQAQEAAMHQAALIAGKQEASKQLKTLLTESERLANVLQLGVKHHYGIRAEKLAEFGLQPFRGRSRKAAPAPELTPRPGVEAEAPAPASDPLNR